MSLETCRVFSLGMIDYCSAWEIQKWIASRIRKGITTNTILLLEHPNVYTIGPRGVRTDIFLSDKQLDELGIKLIETDRGGEITYHGPGQLVVYPIIDTQKFGGPSKFVGILQSLIVEVLEQYQLIAFPVDGRIGVWVSGLQHDKHLIHQENKIAAIGLRFQQGISTHGFALNVNPDLSYFKHIVPCGIKDRGVTSMVRELGREVDLKLLQQRIIVRFAEYLGTEIIFGKNKDIFKGLYSA